MLYFSMLVVVKRKSRRVSGSEKSSMDDPKQPCLSLGLSWLLIGAEPELIDWVEFNIP